MRGYRMTAFNGGEEPVAKELWLYDYDNSSEYASLWSPTVPRISVSRPGASSDWSSYSTSLINFKNISKYKYCHIIGNTSGGTPYGSANSATIWLSNSANKNIKTLYSRGSIGGSSAINVTIDVSDITEDIKINCSVGAQCGSTGNSCWSRLDLTKLWFANE